MISRHHSVDHGATSNHEPTRHALDRLTSLLCSLEPRRSECVSNGVNIGVNISVATGGSYTSHLALGVCPAAIGGG
jgi:hypothetical protein